MTRRPVCHKKNGTNRISSDLANWYHSFFLLCLYLHSLRPGHRRTVFMGWLGRTTQHLEWIDGFFMSLRPDFHGIHQPLHPCSDHRNSKYNFNCQSTSKTRSNFFLSKLPTTLTFQQTTRSRQLAPEADIHPDSRLTPLENATKFRDHPHDTLLVFSPMDPVFHLSVRRH